MDKITFRGAGCNGPSIHVAVQRGIYSPSKDTLPAGVTWPFVKLSLGENSVDFTMAQIHRDVTPADVTKVSLSKLGYVFFRTHDETKDFGFTTFKIEQLLKELQARGYHLDDSCQHNMLAAKISVALTVIIFVAVVTLVTVMSILKPNGV
jgi:hypothetical protein